MRMAPISSFPVSIGTATVVRAPASLASTAPVVPEAESVCSGSSRIFGDLRRLLCRQRASEHCLRTGTNDGVTSSLFGIQRGRPVQRNGAKRFALGSKQYAELGLA